LSAFKDFSDAITSCALDLPGNIRCIFFIALPTPTLSSVITPALPLGLPVVKNFVVIGIRFPVALFITNYGRRRFIVITFPLAARHTLIVTRSSSSSSTLTLFSFRLGRSFYCSLWNSDACLPRRGWRGLLDYWLICFRVLRLRRRRTRNRSLRGVAILVNAYRQSRRDAYADGNQNDQGEQDRTLPERLLNACGITAVLHTNFFLLGEWYDGTRRQRGFRVEVRGRERFVRVSSGRDNYFSYFCHLFSVRREVKNFAVQLSAK
jgi:hypothetical protein